jgi:hypothetical protein
MIPKNILELIIEAGSEYNDGWSRKIYLEKLIEIKNAIDVFLKKKWER